ncbi:putative metallopeptidase [Pseudomonas sp. T8]|uniref:putative metallopeptidase n=1 Tax=Pseudomonas sp. T8 TaxID=645292 RepID=UPI00214827BA|nr:putative metallopeptidase [Pseudomonas sp. T8]UUT22144.1 putative metallopeptidase [Pseudomonas sp. T8]
MGRPMPPESLLELSDLSEVGIRLTPAPEVWDWLHAEILADTGSIHNEDHAHLLDADIRIMWASSSFEKQERRLLGQAEQVAFRAGGWQKARMEQQMRDWFGDVPAFIITLAADYCAQCSDAEFCALIEHELYHLAHAKDKYGQPAFTKEGAPKLEMRGHDVNEFVAIVERYGVGAPDSDVSRMVEAAKTPAKVGRASIANACGTCLLRAV